MRVLELGDSADVSRVQLSDGGLLFALQDLELSDPLLGLTGAVHVRGVGVERAGEDAEERDAPREGIGHRLEDERRDGGAVGAGHLDGVVALLPFERRALIRRRHELHDRVEGEVTADVVRSRTEDDRKDLAGEDLPLEALDQLFLGEPALLEEALHERVVALGDLFDELLARLIRLLAQVRGDLLDAQFSGPVRLVPVQLHRDEIDRAAEVLLLADRDLDRDDALPELPLERLDRAFSGGALAVHFVDDEHRRERELAGELPDLLGADLDPGHAADDDGGGVDHAQSALRFHQEDPEARRVQQVDLVILPFGVGEGAGNRVLPLDLVGVEVGDRGAVQDAPEAGHGSGVEQELRDERRLARVVVTDESDIANLISSVRFHRGGPSGGRELGRGRATS